MNIMDIIEAYAELHDMKTMEVKEQYDKGWLSSYELFDSYLQNEGIFGYTNTIITAFRICYKMD